MGPAHLPGYDDPLALMGALHARLQQRCALLDRLAEHVRRHGSDEGARASAAHVMRMFDQDCPMHHDDEEDDLFPLLRAATPPEESAQLEALIAWLLAQHHEMHAAYEAIRSQLETVADGRLGTIDRDRVDRLHTLCLEHVETEEIELIPFARAHLDAAAIERLGRAMAARRNAPYAGGPSG
jgi:hemerythrin-like domain-containing protein